MYHQHTVFKINAFGDQNIKFILHMLLSEKTRDIGPPIGQSAICFNNFPLEENTHSFVNLSKHFLKNSFLKDLFGERFDFFLNINLVCYIINGLLYCNTCKEGLHVIRNIFTFI